MKHRQFYTFVLIVLVVVAFATSPANAQTTAPGPYYATPSWDQQLQCDSQSTCPRFVVLSNWNNQAVLDRETGLVWERAPGQNRYSQVYAHTVCIRLNLANRKGWRLPTAQELSSLVDQFMYLHNHLPPLPLGHPFQGVQADYYWTSTPEAGDPSFAWLVSFVDGTNPYDLKSTYHYVWCVRGGSGLDPQ